MNPPAVEPAAARRLPISPGAVAGATKSSLYVANFYGSTVTTYAPTAKGNAKPLHAIAGSKTGLNGPYGVAVDASHNVSVVNTNGGSASTAALYAVSLAIAWRVTSRADDVVLPPVEPGPPIYAEG